MWLPRENLGCSCFKFHFSCCRLAPKLPQTAPRLQKTIQPAFHAPRDTASRAPKQPGSRAPSEKFALRSYSLEGTIRAPAPELGRAEPAGSPARAADRALVEQRGSVIPADSSLNLPSARRQTRTVETGRASLKNENLKRLCLNPRTGEELSVLFDNSEGARPNAGLAKCARFLEARDECGFVVTRRDVLVEDGLSDVQVGRLGFFFDSFCTDFSRCQELFKSQVNGRLIWARRC